MAAGAQALGRREHGAADGTLPPSPTSLGLKRASLFPANPENVRGGQGTGPGVLSRGPPGYTPGLLGDEASHILCLSPRLISHTEAASAWPGHHRCMSGHFAEDEAANKA